MNPNWNSVSLQLHLNGAGGSTTFVDSSNSAHSVTAAGNAAISTAQSVFGGASLGLDGAGDYLSISSSSAFGFGTAAWTVECHVRLTALGSDRGLFDFRPGVSAAAGFFYVSSTGRLAYYDGSTVRGDAGTALSTGAWYHVAFSYDGASMRAFVNGELVWSAAFTPNFSTARPLVIGANFAGTAALAGHIDEIRVTKGVALYTAAFTPSTEAFPDGYQALVSVGSVLQPAAIVGMIVPRALVAAPAVLGAPRLLSTLNWARASAAGPLGAPYLMARALFTRLSVGSPLGAAAALAFHDFTGQIDPGAPLRYVMDLTTPDGLVRAPISSWQATLQTGRSSYLQCVIPACEPYLDAINAATAFTINRIAGLVDGSSIEYQMATSPVGTKSLSQGTSNWTAVVDGYADATPEDDDPPEAYNRTLQDVRTISTQASGLRVRCGVDWLLRPAMRALLGDTPFIVSYINYYVTNGDQYMDVGERVEPV